MGPPRPVASISSTAAIIGESKTAEMAAKLPAAARTMSSWGGASRFASETSQTVRPGAEGDERRLRPEHDAEADRRRARPGGRRAGSTGSVAPALKPSTGTWPPRPGSFSMARPTITPATSSTGSGHHHGHRPEPQRRRADRRRPRLDAADRLQEGPGDEGDDQADNGGEHQQHDEVAAPHRGDRIHRGVVAHSSFPSASQGNVSTAADGRSTPDRGRSVCDASPRDADPRCRGGNGSWPGEPQREGEDARHAWHRYHRPHEERLHDGPLATVGEEQHVDEDDEGGEEQHQPQRCRDDADGAVDPVAARLLPVRRLVEPLAVRGLLGGRLRIDREQGAGTASRPMGSAPRRACPPPCGPTARRPPNGRSRPAGR